MRRLSILAFLVCFALPVHAKTVTCTDGTTSKSGRGACSHHGGVAAAQPETGKPAAEKPAAEKSAAATVTCKDGTTSKSGRGACSHHGGVGDAAATPPAATPPAAAPHSSKATVPTSAGAPKSADEKEAANRPTGATAKCTDGTYSHSAHHPGACSHHGGVAEWTQ